MTQLVLAGDGSPFDRIRRVDDSGEYWTARELMPLLGYEKWERFEDAIERARLSIANIGSDPDREASRRREAFGRTRQIGTDYRLSRYAAYLIAMNGDVRKAEVAAAQTYFAVRTREAETAPARRELSKLEVLEMALESERQRLLAVDRADRAEARVLELVPAAQSWEAVQAGNGVTLRTFHKKYFSDVPERVFFEHLYAKGYLIDQRGKGGWSERRQKYCDGSQHRHPTAKGKAWLYLHASVDADENRREGPRVRPGEPELELRDRLAREGLKPNTGTDVARPA